MDINNVSVMTTKALEGNPVILQSKAAVAVLGMSMDMADRSGDALVKMMEASVSPNLGQNIDIRV